MIYCSILVLWEVVFLLVIHLHTVQGSLFTMLSTDQHHIVDAGRQLSLRCEFYKSEFNLFDNPVQWKKSQYGEESELNIMGNIKEPFESTGRFVVTFAAHPPRYVLVLTIKNMSRVDSGNYTCEVKGPKSAELGIVKYTVFVKAPVEDVFIVQGNASYRDDGSSTAAITFVENEPTPIRCIAKGGSPPPDMEISIGREDYTKYFRFDSVPAISGQIGFRISQMTTMLVTDDFRATARDGGKKLKCKAEVPGLPQVVKSAQIAVYYAPRIVCTSASAYIKEKNIFLSCDITAHPPVTSWHWILGDNGTTLIEGEVTNGFWTVFNQRDENLHIKLYLREAKEDSFRYYTVVVDNKIATRRQEVPLQRRYREAESGRRDGSNGKRPMVKNRLTGQISRDAQSPYESGRGHATQHCHSTLLAMVCVAVAALWHRSL